MRKYFFVFKATLIESLQYVINILLGFITFFMILFVFINLWEYIYSDSANLISGYSMKQMIWYVIFTEIMWFGGGNKTLNRQISNDIKSGTIAYGINRPYHYLFYIIAKHLGEISIKLFLFLGAGLAIGYAFIGSIPGFALYQLPFVLISLFLGIMINSFIRMAISVLSFWIEDSTPFHWIYDKIILVIGTMFPVEMFPAALQPIIRYSPIFVVTYGPAKLMIDFGWEKLVQVLLSQTVYFIVTLFLLFAFYQKGVKKINVNGG
jgi:ABC-2 type transport system permease protein